jgi:predicted transposase YdaD
LKGKAEGKAEGELKKAIEIAGKSKKRGMPIADISELTGLTEDEIREIE